MLTPRWSTAILLLAIAGCGSTGPTALDELSLAEGRWERAGPDRYEFELRVVCFCPGEYAQWHRVRVADGAITALVNVETQQPVPPARWDEWNTIDRVFERIRQFVESDVFGRLDASYHPVLGYPFSANLVAREGVADAGILFEVRAFVADGSGSE